MWLQGVSGAGGQVRPAHGVAMVRSYLPKHGGQTGQTTSSLELMANKGDAMSLQAVADRNDWTMDQLADRTVPTGGTDDDGRWELACSGVDRVYVARLDEKRNLTLINPHGNTAKALPSGTDDDTKAVRNSTVGNQERDQAREGGRTNRLFEALYCGRTWTVEDWRPDFHGHPMMRRLIDNLIW